MKPETAQFLGYARDLLDRMRQMVAAGLLDDAGRNAYLACFHVAQAIIFEREDRILKTHRGVQGEFYRLVHRDGRADPRLATFLPRAYRFKAVADYAVEATAHASAEEIRAATEDAGRFVALFATLIEPP